MPLNSGCCIKRHGFCVKIKISPYELDLYFIRHGQSLFNKLQSEIGPGKVIKFFKNNGKKKKPAFNFKWH